MMDERKTVFNYLEQIFATYGTIVLIFLVFGMAIGEPAKGHSSLFALGAQGFSTKTLFQLFCLSIIIAASNEVFLTGRWIRNMNMVLRNVCFFCSIIIVIGLFAVSFNWFPVNEWKPWLGFGISFLISSVISVIVSRLKEKMENKKMKMALEEFKKME